MPVVSLDLLLGDFQHYVLDGFITHFVHPWTSFFSTVNHASGHSNTAFNISQSGANGYGSQEQYGPSGFGATSNQYGGQQVVDTTGGAFNSGSTSAIQPIHGDEFDMARANPQDFADSMAVKIAAKEAAKQIAHLKSTSPPPTAVQLYHPIDFASSTSAYHGPNGLKVGDESHKIDFDSFQPDKALVPGNGYWCSSGFDKKDHEIVFEGQLNQRFPSYGLKVDWVYAPREVKVEYSADGKHYQTAIDWHENKSQEDIQNEDAQKNASAQYKAAHMNDQEIQNQVTDGSEDDANDTDQESYTQDMLFDGPKNVKTFKLIMKAEPNRHYVGINQIAMISMLPKPHVGSDSPAAVPHFGILSFGVSPVTPAFARKHELEEIRAALG